MMEERIWILIGKKFSSSLTEAEEEELNNLLPQYPEAQYTMEVLQSCWRVRESESMREIPEDDDVDIFMNRLARARKFPAIDWIGLAIISALLALGIWIYRDVVVPLSRTTATIATNTGNNQIITRYGSRTHVVLPDGSEVWLNAGSTLSYAENFAMTDEREVYLQGEAYFDVHHDKTHPFVIHTTDMDIRDLGTVFNVKAYPDDPTTEATLISGAIEIILKQNDQHVLLKPREKLIWYRLKDSVAFHSTPITDSLQHPRQYIVQDIHLDRKYKLYPETAWMENKLIFENESFAELAREMERRYAVQINICCEDIAQTPLTGSFTDETLQQALDELRLITHFTYQIKDHEVFINHETQYDANR